MWMSPAAATFLCAIAGTRAVFLLFTFLLQYFSRTIARAHREREREREWPASDFYSARVQILASFLRPLVEQIFRRPRSSLAEEQTPNPPLAKGIANRFKRDQQSRYRSNVYEEGNENVGRRFNRSGNICWTARTPAGQFRPGSSGSPSRSLLLLSFSKR